MTTSFINVSNHPSSKWSQKQLEAALALADSIIDVPFPNVPADASTSDVKDLAEELVTNKVWPHINDYKVEPMTVLVQGEMTLTAAILKILQVPGNGINCVAACSERKSVETQNPDGTTTKTAIFEFVQFRSYPD